MVAKNTFALLLQKRFSPFFLTQFFGAFNDNLFKNALMILLIFTAVKLNMSQDTLMNLCAMLFILPFFIFSAFAGQLADKFEKSKLIIFIKIADLFLVLLALLGFYFNHLILLLFSLFLFGTQATFFSPVKYSILPHHLQETELLGGNGLIEMGTFIAILTGTILGGILIAIPHTGVFWVSIAMTITAIIGMGCSLYIPKTKSLNAHLKLDWNFLRQTIQIIKYSCEDKKLFYTILGISWFWLYGTIFLTQIPHFTKIDLHANEYVATLLLVCFSLGVGLGSTVCNWLSAKKIEMGFVLLGLFGLSLFAIDMALSHTHPPAEILNVSDFIFYGQNWRILIDAFLVGGFGGIYLVPLYTLMQTESKPEHCSQVVAANNIINSIFMVAASIFAMFILNCGFSIPELFIFTAILNCIMVAYLLKLNKLINFHQDIKLNTELNTLDSP